MTQKTMRIGANTNFDAVCAGSVPFSCIKDCVDFLVCHTDPQTMPFSQAVQKAKSACDTLENLSVDYIANFEFQNFIHNVTAPDGTEWALNTDTLHRLEIPDEYLRILAQGNHFLGVMYDELEHAIINRNISITLASKGKIKKNVFELSENADPVAQGELLGSQLAEYADSLKSKGAPRLLGEHVFPVLFHTFARNGLTPNFKSQKESVSNIQFAIAAGAALEYGTELWNCVDCWFRNTNPGHSADEMYNNMLFGYYAGINSLYVESTAVFEKDGNVNDYCEAFRKFSSEYRGKDRDWDIHDFRPEIGIIRYDDTYWGQGDPFIWRNMLFGNKRIKPGNESKEYVSVFHMLTQGDTPKGSFSWDKVSPHSLSPHRSFVTMNSTAVFDDRVGKDTLESLKLCFLSGIHISDVTLQAVSELVKENGLTVVTPKRFAPESILEKAGEAYSEIPDGKGLWIVSNDISSRKVRQRIKPFLGNKNEIRLTFKNREIRLHISSEGNRITCV